MPETVTRQGLYEMMTAVRKTGVFRAGVELKIFDALADGPATAQETARYSHTDPRATLILLRALAAIGLIDTDGERFWLAPGADDVLVTGRPGYYGDAVKLAVSDHEWEALRRLADAVRQGGSVMSVNAETPDFSLWEDFAELGTLNTPPVASLIADVIVPWADRRARLDVLDVACGHGWYGFTLAQRDPKARVWALDWPNVLAVTERNADKLGVRERVDLIPGDMFHVPLGGPYDVVIVANVLHHFSEERAQRLLTRLASAVKPGGRLVCVAIAYGTERPAEDPIPHLFSALMLAWTTQGQVHSIDTYTDLVAASGFTRPQVHHVPGNPLRILIADRL